MRDASTEPIESLRTDDGLIRVSAAYAAQQRLTDGERVSYEVEWNGSAVRHEATVRVEPTKALLGPLEAVASWGIRAL